MNNDLAAGACAAADLAARLARDVALARADLAMSEQRFRDAAGGASPAGPTVPLAIRRELATARCRLASLEQVLSGVLGADGDCRAASA